MKKIVSLLLLILMFISLIPTVSMADTVNFELSKPLTFTASGTSTLKITNMHKAGKYVGSNYVSDYPYYASWTVLYATGTSAQQPATANYNSYTFDTAVTLNDGQWISFKGIQNEYTNYNEYLQFIMSSGSWAASGNIMSLCSGDSFATTTEIPSDNCFHDLFNNCNILTTAPLLPATTLTMSCYQWMFMNCTSLIAAPDLPATTLCMQCYYGMFYNCSSMKKAPYLPAETLISSCYNQMFYGCTSLKIFATTTDLGTDGLIIGPHNYTNSAWAANIFSGCIVTPTDSLNIYFSNSPKNEYYYYGPVDTKYSISTNTSGSGIVLLDKNQADKDSTVTVTASPSDGHILKSITVTTASNTNVPYSTTTDINKYTFKMPAENVTVYLVFEKMAKVSTATNTGLKDIYVDKGYAASGTDINITATPTDGYKIDYVKISKTSPTSVVIASSTNNPWTYTVTDNEDIVASAECSLKDYNISTKTDVTNGTVSFAKTSAHMNEVATITTIPDEGYKLDIISVSKKSSATDIVYSTTTNVQIHTFTMPTDDVEVTVSFTQIDYTISTKTDVTNGTVSFAKTSAYKGDIATITTLPNEGYKLKSISVTKASSTDAAVYSTTTDIQTHTFTMPASNVEVSVEYEKKNYSISTGTNIINGTVSFVNTAYMGDVATITTLPSSGYRLKSISVKKSSNTDVTYSTTTDINKYTFTMPADNVKVYVEFEKLTNITKATPIHGSFSVDQTQVASGTNITITATPTDGYALTSINVAKASNTSVVIASNTSSPWSYKVPDTDDLQVSAVFTAIDYSISTTTDIINGTVSFDTTTAHVGDMATITTLPDTGYRLKSLSVKASSTDAEINYSTNENTYTFTMPADNVKVSVEFEKMAKVSSATNIQNGSVSFSKVYVASGTNVTITATPTDGYKFKYMSVAKASSTDVILATKTDSSSWVYTVRDSEDIVVYAEFEKAYKIATNSDIENGSISIDPTEAVKDTIVTITVNVNTGYECTSVTYKNQSGENTPIALTKDTNNNTWYFSMPEYDVYISAVINKTEVQEETIEVVDSTPIVSPKSKPIPSIYIGEHSVIKVDVDNNKYIVNDVSRDSIATIFIEQGRTYLGVRDMAYALGIDSMAIRWNNTTKTATISKAGATLEIAQGSDVVKLTYGGYIYSIKTDASAKIKGDRIYLPFRVVFEVFGYEVSWDNGTKTISCQ